MRKHLKLFMLVMLICCTLTNIFGNNDVQAKEVSDNPYLSLMEILLLKKAKIIIMKILENILYGGTKEG